jgi:hypothetical protein
MDEERPDIRDVVGFLGVLAARRGDREEALRRAERVAQIGSPYEHGRGVYWQACIAAQLGDHERGISLLLEAYSQGRAMDVGLHSDMDLEPLHDDPRYQELVRPKG